jgi:hypothetical protein
MRTLVTENRAGTALLDSYEAERRPVAAEVLASTSSMTRLVLGDTVVARLVRDRVFVPLLNRPWVQRQIWEQASQLTLSYRGGPLDSPRRWSPSWQPGDRVPDLGCRRQDGARTQLHAELGLSLRCGAGCGDGVPRSAGEEVGGELRGSGPVQQPQGAAAACRARGGQLGLARAAQRHGHRGSLR